MGTTDLTEDQHRRHKTSGLTVGIQAAYPVESQMSLATYVQKAIQSGRFPLTVMDT